MLVSRMNAHRIRILWKRKLRRLFRREDCFGVRLIVLIWEGLSQVFI